MNRLKNIKDKLVNISLNFLLKYYRFFKVLIYFLENQT